MSVHQLDELGRIRIRVTNHGPWHGRRIDVEPGPDGDLPARIKIEPDESVTDPETRRIIGRMVPEEAS